MRVGAALLACCWVVTALAGDVRAPRSFLSPELQALQDDPARHPGWLWVEQGEALWRAAPPDSGKQACAGCHGDIASMSGVAARYPAVASDGALLNLELRIERCRAEQQGASAFGYESEALLSLTAAIAARSRGQPVNVRVDGPAAARLADGRRLYSLRQGQLNLSCQQCHEENVGKRLRGDVISHGLGTGYPAYRLEWNGVGSLHRRLRACSLGVRAVQAPFGSPDYLALELFLADKARGLAVEAPGIRR